MRAPLLLSDLSSSSPQHAYPQREGLHGGTRNFALRIGALREKREAGVMEQEIHA